MTDIMVDIEAMGRGSFASIVQIGAGMFDRYSGEVLHTFKINIDIQSCIDAGFNIDGPVIAWWMNQSEEARKSILELPTFPIKTALKKFSEWIKENRLDNNIKIWSHSTFDFVILTNAFTKVKVAKPWHYRDARDIRTLTDLAELKKNDFEEFNGVKHDALADVLHQIKYCVYCFNIIKDNKNASIS